MLSRRVIPCLDVKDGRVVKGINFVDLRDAGDPVEQAAAYDLAGADEVCFLDISASPEGRSTLVDVVARTAPTVTVTTMVVAPLSSGSAKVMLALDAFRTSVVEPSLTVTLLAVILPGSLMDEMNRSRVPRVTL